MRRGWMRNKWSGVKSVHDSWGAAAAGMSAPPDQAHRRGGRAKAGSHNLENPEKRKGSRTVVSGRVDLVLPDHWAGARRVPRRRV
jgi:hypothetical protein